MTLISSCTFCSHGALELVTTFTSPPPNEVCFAPVANAVYRRDLHRCTRCGHFFSTHDMDLGQLYTSAYADANYGDDRLRQTFEQIIALPPNQSDNAFRVKRVNMYSRPHLKDTPLALDVLDVGSGLGVFPHAMKQAGWNVTALDPDSRQAQHARNVVGVSAIHADFMTAQNLPKFSLVTFNKVLEHVREPISMLARARPILKPGGICYVELPDGEAAIEDPEGAAREEFTIDHPHVFSAASMALLAQRSGFRVDFMERIREPSTKYTLYTFLTAAPK